MTFKLSDHPSVANQFLAELRDVQVQTDRMRFRRNLERLGEVLAYEISKTLSYETREVETPLGMATMQLPASRVVLATILRAGLPLHQGMLSFFDQAGSAFISAYRKHHKDGSFEISMEYVSCPELDGCTLIVIDPMMATGASMDVTLKALLENGTPEKIHIVSAVASSHALESIRRLHPDTSVWIGAEDEELTARSYIVPGLGDAGDLCYGEKLQD
jgi:uracil phosphoribosyltransferase